MKLVGILVVLAGWLVAVVGLGITESTGLRLLLAILGFAICLLGILGVLNKAHMKNAVWKA
jgi:hypothetical protein